MNIFGVKMNRFIRNLILTTLVYTSILFGIKAAGVSEIPSRTEQKTTVKTKITEVPVLMYHQIGRRASRYCVTPQNFRKELQELYDRGYASVSIEDYVNGKINLPDGKRAVILTFDDGSRGQFNYIAGNDGSLAIDPDCAVGILEDFYKHNPDFGNQATFFICIRFTPFGQKEYVKEKLNAILDMGMHIGNHTYSHSNVRASSDKKIDRELGRFMETLEGYIGDRISRVNVIAYPFGATPRSSRIEKILEDFEYNGKRYTFIAAMHAWGGPAEYPVPANKLWRIPRIETHNLLPSYILKDDFGIERDDMVKMVNPQ